MKTFRTFHFGAATMLRFCLGPEAHTSTSVEVNKRISYEFDDSNNLAKQLIDVFFSDEGMAVGDARALIEATRDIKRTMSACIKSPDGIWTNPLATSQPTEVQA